MSNHSSDLVTFGKVIGPSRPTTAVGTSIAGLPASAIELPWMPMALTPLLNLSCKRSDILPKMPLPGRVS
ncbi:unnamed protein product [Pseudo-nitzschia multistriata]|uniref:Uncharacterized protein n=1 Tax=Pseudo-nitzschia multistriata TaxID=183589 RepID=A0A448YXH1_9STRA|nr:unnamed protein product [Pseudo-nitzschia multistriata]